jgi:cholestenol delta-isomerase
MLNHDRMVSAQDFFGQLWKEYALSDSRYLTSDTLVLCMETVTVVSISSREICSVMLIMPQLLWGPLCFGVAYSILYNRSLRHPLQIIVCMAHLYGDTLYFATSLYDDHVHGRPYCRPEPFYFWVYYFFMNFIWIVVPACGFSASPRQGLSLMRCLDYLHQSMKTISQAMRKLDADSLSRKAQ